MNIFQNKAHTYLFIAIAFMLGAAALEYMHRGQVPLQISTSDISNKLTSDTEQVIPVFKIIREYDPAGYGALLNDVQKLASMYGNTPEFTAQSVAMGQKAAMKYYRHASVQSLNTHLNTQIALMGEMTNVDPVMTCQFAYPGLFGSSKQREMVKLKSFAPFLEAFKAIVISGTRRDFNGGNDAAPFNLNAFIAKFEKLHPAEFKILQKAESNDKSVDTAHLSKAILLFTQSMANQGSEKAASMRRYILGGT